MTGQGTLPIASGCRPKAVSAVAFSRGYLKSPQSQYGLRDWMTTAIRSWEPLRWNVYRSDWVGRCSGLFHPSEKPSRPEEGHRSLCSAASVQLEHFQQKCEAALRRTVRENKQIERFCNSEKSGIALATVWRVAAFAAPLP